MSRGSDRTLPPSRDPSGPYRVCFVCLGNICRSPMAEVVLRERLDAAGLADQVTVDSAGTGDWHVGDPMHKGSRTQLAARGYDGSAHRARQFRAPWLAERDLILAMDASNLATLKSLAGNTNTGNTNTGNTNTGNTEAINRIRLFGDVAELNGADVPDPYGSDGEEFARVLDILESGMARLVDQLRNLPETRPADR